MKEQNICELVDEEKHAEESIEISSVKFMVESDNRLVETGTSVNAMKAEINEGYMIHFSEEQESDDAHKNLKQKALPEGSFMAASKEKSSDASLGGSTAETTSVISSDNVVMDRSVRMQKGDECASTGPLSSVQEDIKDNETNGNGRRNEESARNRKPKSPKLGENSVNQKNSEVQEDNGSGLTTVNSILGAESPSTQAVKGEGGKEWNSPARYPAGIKRQNKKVKSKPFWIQFVCCSSVDPQRR
ncbi:hypothetical protein SESBI_10196 [Sesbania bispinosa]|nr:hypothetical protein SESBI_10196 [Sesbania bispinosa]